MNRLQKKCVIATVGMHLLLLTILVVGPAFYNPQPKADNTPVLDIIPANLIDAAFNSGVKGAQLPPPTPVVVPPQPPPVVTPQPQLTPPASKPVEPVPSIPERIKNFFKPEPVKPAPERTETQPHKIQPNLTPTVRTVPKNSPSKSKPDNTRDNTTAINKAIKALQKNLAPAAIIDMPGNSSVSYANYAAVVKSIYEQAWTPPTDTASDDANAKVTVTIARDGTVISARVIAPSGDAATDNSVQRTLDRVTFIAPFPDDSTDKERTYTINFNLKAKRMLE